MDVGDDNMFFLKDNCLNYNVTINFFYNDMELKLCEVSKDDLNLIIKKAEYLSIDLVIAPRGSTIPTKDYVMVTSATLRDYIDAQTITVEEDVIVDELENPNQEVNEQNNVQIVE